MFGIQAPTVHWKKLISCEPTLSKNIIFWVDDVIAVSSDGSSLVLSSKVWDRAWASKHKSKAQAWKNLYLSLQLNDSFIFFSVSFAALPCLHYSCLAYFKYVYGMWLEIKIIILLTVLGSNTSILQFSPLMEHSHSHSRNLSFLFPFLRHLRC